MDFNFGSYVKEFVAFLFLLVLLTYMLKNGGKDFNSLIGGLSDTYVKTFKGLQAN
jgi:hypothetical protein